MKNLKKFEKKVYKIVNNYTGKNLTFSLMSSHNYISIFIHDIINGGIVWDNSSNSSDYTKDNCSLMLKDIIYHVKTRG